MSLRVWLVLFIISMAINAEVLAWAVQHGQFSDVNRGRWMPLRSQPQPGSAPRRRPWALAAILAGLAIMTLAWLNGMTTLILQSFGH